MDKSGPSNNHSELGHEHSDANAMSIVKFGLALAVVIFICLYAMAQLGDYFATHQTETGPRPSPLVKGRLLPPGPLLQTSETADIKSFLEYQEATLKSYGWVDQQNGVVRIPIDRAMELLVQRGLPVRGQTAAPQAGGKGKQ